MSNLVAIIGRPNVGKSTLFNRLVGYRQAIVNDESGVTRDRHYGTCEWNGKTFNVVDTGGYVPSTKDIFEIAIKDQIKLAIEECSVIIFMVDVKTGITDYDSEIAKLLRGSKKPCFLVVNKIDNNQVINEIHEFYKLGLDPIFPVSSMTGSGTGELLDAIDPHIIVEEEKEVIRIPKIAIVGRPNVGKSSLLNSLLDEERNIVTPIAGTTRDSIHTYYNKYNHEFMFIDTAGLRKKGKEMEDVEFYSTMRAIKAVDEADICLVMLDSQLGLQAQDLNIIRLAERRYKGIVIVVNKWDLVEKTNASTIEFTKAIKEKMEPFTDVPILFVSALTKQRIFKVLEVCQEVFDCATKKIPTAKLNDYLLAEIGAYPPPANKGKYIKIKYVTQLPTPSPKFALFCNLPQYIKEPYKRFVENRLRSKFGFTGVPIEVFFRKK